MTACYLGIDVGTGSARAGIFDAQGILLAHAKTDISLFRQGEYIAEQSSEEIWQAVCSAVRQSLALARIAPEQIGGIGFDATCSLVVLGENGAPLSVTSGDQTDRNIIVWMDHRAIDQAERINATGNEVLRYVGGAISPEMETPKLLWLKENLPATYEQAWQFLDLTDFLTWRATGDLARSVCTVTCKWTYLSYENRWSADYFRAIGLEDLADEGFSRIGTTVLTPGTALGQGLTREAADQLGLLSGTPVAAGLIDAHAGGVGTVGASGPQGDLTSRMAYIFGTSACAMASTKDPAFVPGVWGPYYSAMVPGLWLCEGGQSAAGAAIDHLLTHHPYFPAAQERAKTAGLSVAAWLGTQVAAAGAAPQAIVEHVKDLHIVPEFLGNRSPLADPHAKAIIAGLDMRSDKQAFIDFYLAGLCAIGYGARQILTALAEQGVIVDTIAISGGAGQSGLVRQILADTTGISVAASDCQEPVLLGSAILGAVAAGTHRSVHDAMGAMSRQGEIYHPAQGVVAESHKRRFEVFEHLQKTGQKIRNIGNLS
ncbi:FGGY-family carbohydrate kinase [Pelagibacterium lentulum]|uniref:Ribulokinase n=1 Tax=Pelagibacterium lentulum TaxID=2029865 RepID=A0A916VUD1_9HYPH|nr:FGGY-family carbohydrate kinase [Pelagibacterium lentulum]GGA38912.1 ribulokinase [Pelagibacterium lentulum]